jgi:hypothetical protein
MKAELLKNLEEYNHEQTLYERCLKDENFTELVTIMVKFFRKTCLEIYRKKEVKLTDKKAVLCVSWFRYLDNFKPTRNTEERRILSNIFGNECGADKLMHIFATHLHSAVYNMLYGNIYEKKKVFQEENMNAEYIVNRECNEKIYCFAGSSLHRMKKNRKRALDGKGRKVSDAQRKVVEEELNFIDSLTEKNKKGIKLKSCFVTQLDMAESDEGGLCFPSKDLDDFLLSLDQKVREQVNVKALNRYGASMLRIAEDCLTNDLELSSVFLDIVQKSSLNVNPPIAQSVMKELVKKYLHAREGEFKDAQEEIELSKTDSVVSSSQNLRDTLKTFSVTKKRKL